jgi:hypothetical protein
MEKEATEKTTLRNKSIGTKVSEEEFAALLPIRWRSRSGFEMPRFAVRHPNAHQ